MNMPTERAFEARGLALGLSRYLAERLCIDMILLGPGGELHAATHRARPWLDDMSRERRAGLARRLTTLCAARGAVVTHIESDDGDATEVCAFELLDGIAIVLSGPDYTRLPVVAGLQCLYRLTPAESRVARLLATTMSPRAIADELSVSLSTIRTHLRAIQGKLGASSQSDLVRRLLSSAAILAPERGAAAHVSAPATSARPAGARSAVPIASLAARVDK